MTPDTKAAGRYLSWLRAQGLPVYEAGGIQWTTYRSALVPVVDIPRPVSASDSEVRRMLRQSGAWLARYPGGLVESPDSDDGWYYTVCDQFAPMAELRKKVRYEVRAGMNACSVRPVSADWLASNGYACYRAAERGYRNVRAASEDAFQLNLRQQADAPFEHWGVFVGDALAGYASSTILDEEWVAHSVAKYDPGALKERTAYVLVRALIDEYVGNRHLSLINGTRTVAHDTNYNQFLRRLGFVARHCTLKVVYQPALAATLRLAYPFRGLIFRLPDAGLVHSARGVLEMERLRRSQ